MRVLKTELSPMRRPCASAALGRRKGPRSHNLELGTLVSSPIVLKWRAALQEEERPLVLFI